MNLVYYNMPSIHEGYVDSFLKKSGFSMEKISFDNISLLGERLSKGDALGIIPFENVRFGTQTSLCDIITFYDLNILGEFISDTLCDERVYDSEKILIRNLLVGKKKPLSNLVSNWNHKLQSELIENTSCFKTSLILEVKNIPAALYKVLGAFATQQINISKIATVFDGNSFGLSSTIYFEFDEKLPKYKANEVFSEIELYANNLRVLGTYVKYS